MTSVPDYVELRCRSAFSFLAGASLPEDLVDRAAALGYDTLALADRNGVYGAPRFFQAARRAGLRPLVGAEVPIAGAGLLWLLVESREGYRNLCRLLATAERHLKAPAEMAARFADLPEAIRQSRRIAERCAFTLADLGYRFPDFPLPAGATPASHLRELTYAGARDRYHTITPRIRRQLEHE